MEPFHLTLDVYEALDPGCCVVATDESGALMGSAFFHPRETHVGIGVVMVHPSAFGRGIGRAMMEEINRVAEGKPLRLVASAMNLDSFSLDTRLGFVPQMLLQSMTMQVLVEGLPSSSRRMRDATMADISTIADFELATSGFAAVPWANTTAGTSAKTADRTLQDFMADWNLCCRPDHDGCADVKIATVIHHLCDVQRRSLSRVFGPTRSLRSTVVGAKKGTGAKFAPVPLTHSREKHRHGPLAEQDRFADRAVFLKQRAEVGG